MPIQPPTEWPGWLRVTAMTTIAVALYLVLSWAGGVAGTGRGPKWQRPVVVDGKVRGHVRLQPLQKAPDGRWSLNVYFAPEGDDLGVLRDYNLRWWQVVDRENLPGYPRIDLQRGNTLPGSPGDDDDPAYYTREEKLGLGGYFSPDEIFEDNKYWMRDTPVPENGAHFETWLVQQEEHEVRLLSGFEWELFAHKGEVWNVSGPEFIEVSRYNLEDILAHSGFGDNWIVIKSPPVRSD